MTLVWLYAVRALFCPYGAETSGQHGPNFIPGAAPRRLIERGAVLEGIFPLAPDLSGAEVKAFLITLSHLPGAAELTANLPKSGDTP